MSVQEAVEAVTLAVVGGLTPVVVLWACWNVGAHWLRSVMEDGG